MKTLFLSLLSCLLLAHYGQAQQAKGQLDIQFNKAVLQPGDSLAVTVNYKDSIGKTNASSLATLELIIENEQGERTRLRWPMIDGQASGTLYLPDSLPAGKYAFLAGLQQRFFEVVGKVQNEGYRGSIQAMLLTKDGDWDVQQVPVADDGSFLVRNWLFEEDAIMAFSGTRNSQEQLNIRISTQLDSSFEPIAVAGRTFYVGTPPSEVQATLNQPIEAPENLFADRGTVLPAVVVKSVAKTPAQQYDEEYVSGLFRSGDERVISIMDDPSAPGINNIFAYLQGRIAGLQITPYGFNGGAARWRGSPVTFFLDEMRVSPQQIANIPMTDIAIVKAYPPPFLGAFGGGGGVAVYTRRGGERNFLPAGRQVFRVKGYTPATAVLNIDKLSVLWESWSN